MRVGAVISAPTHLCNVVTIQSNELYRVIEKPEVMKHVGSGTMARPEVAELVFRSIKSWREIGMGWWTIRLRDDERLVGEICLRPEKDAGEIAIGYGIDTPFWRRGYAREAVTTVLRYGFDRRLAERFVAVVRPENSASCALLQVCGFVRQPDLVLKDKIRRLYAHDGRPAVC